MSATPHAVGPVADDLLAQDAILAQVRDRYRGVAGRATTVAARLYDPPELAGIPAGASDAALGVNHPLRFATPRPGEVVLDIGCGAGIDTLLAARAVGPQGRAIGLDTLPEMVDLTRVHAARASLANVEVLRGEMERMPLPDASVDLVISNGVVNLSPRKARAFAEMFRVLRPGGRLALADIVLDEDLPPEVMTDPDAWAG